MQDQLGQVNPPLHHISHFIHGPDIPRIRAPFPLRAEPEQR